MSQALESYAASVLALSTGAALARRFPRHIPVAALFLFGLVADLVQHGARPFYVNATRPLAGSARVWGQFGQAAFAAYPWAVLAVALLVLSRSGGGRARVAALGALWVLYEAVLLLGYRLLELRERRLGWVYLGVQLLLVGALAVLGGRWWDRWRRARRRPFTSEVVLLLVAGAELIILAGPMLRGQPWESWTRMAGPPYLFVYVVATLIQGGALWILPRSSSE